MATLQELVRERGLEARVRLLGHVDRVEDLLRAADVFVLASGSEGLPNALLEAMACGLPVVATGVGGVPEVVEGGTSGLLVEPGEPAALVEAIGTLCDRPELARGLGEAARRRMMAWPESSSHLCYLGLYRDRVLPAAGSSRVRSGLGGKPTT